MILLCTVPAFEPVHDDRGVDGLGGLGGLHDRLVRGRWARDLLPTRSDWHRHRSFAKRKVSLLTDKCLRHKKNEHHREAVVPSLLNAF